MDATASTPATTFRAILGGLCPRCRQAAIFDHSKFRVFGRMHRHCPVCGLKYEREPGYFLGAMYISYGLALPLIGLLAILIYATTGWTWEKLFVAAMVVFLPLTPLLARVSRVLWIYFDRKVDPE
jgi:uncharacterized protein (DUF983 family)